MTYCRIYGRLRIRKASDLSTVFTYKLNTGGLNLYQANGRYFLAESKTSVDRIELGDVVTFDAIGKFSVGSMTAQTIMAGQAYLLTLTVDVAFLTDENTAYPVTIDPTIEVSDKETAGNIEDVSIYSGRPTTNGNWTFLHSGYYDDTYKVARTLVRLKGLTSSSIYASLSDSNITKAEFHIFEATGSAPVAVELYSITGNSAWTESGVNWNNASYTLGTKYATASPSYNQKTVYDITNLVKAWKNGSETAGCGFILKSTNETSVDKAFLSSEYATTASRPCVKLTYTSEVSLNSTSFAIDEGSSRTLTATTSDGGTVTWSSSNTTVATVTSGGRVTGVKAGKATITATMTDGTSASSVVYVTIADGVYRIKSSSIGLYLGTYGSIAENTSARMLAYSNEGLTQLQQLWKITYIASGYYSIRPMHKLDMTLHANGTSGSSVDIVTSGTTDTPSSILAVNCWGICVTSDGTAYNINHINTSSLGMRYADGATSPGLGVITAVNSGTASSFNWALEMAQGVFLYDSTYSLPDAANPVEIELGKTQTLSELGVTIEFNEIDGYTWSSNSPTCIAVDENTGDVTALKRGDATLTFTAWSGAAEYTAQVYIASIETIYVKNYYDSTVAGNTEVIQNISNAVGFLDIVYRDEFNLRFVMNGSPEQYNDAAVDICDNGDRHYCTYSNETNCSALCTGHHKNVHRIANELYPSVSNTVVVMWSNCKEGIYCESLDGVHITKEIELALVTFEEVGNMRMHAPVVQFLTINQNQLIRDYGSDDVFMAITLAHEIAHTLGVNDVYNNSYYPDVTVHTNYASVQCIMAYFDQANAENFYQSIQNGTSAFCTDCIELLHSEMVENVYEN